MSLSPSLSNINLRVYNAFARLKQALDAEPSHSQYRMIWSGRLSTFMDRIRDCNQVITQSNICEALETCSGYGPWVATNILLRYYDNASDDSWIDDVKMRIQRAAKYRSALSRHADAARVARAARGRGRGRRQGRGRGPPQGTIVRGVGGVMAVGRGRGRRRGRGRGRGRVARQPSGVSIFLYSHFAVDIVALEHLDI